jgi:large subunit ribosomal protein L32
VAVPKRRTSRSNTRSRRAQWKASAPTLVPCNNRACGQLKPPHVACPHCGTYEGRQIVTPA